MESIINDIVSIDAKAQNRLAEALEFEEKYKRELAEKIEETNRLLSEEEKARIIKVSEIETEFAQKEKELIAQGRDKALENIQDIFNQNHATLEAAIFKNVTNSTL